jgi:hypothetical protein
MWSSYTGLEPSHFSSPPPGFYVAPSAGWVPCHSSASTLLTPRGQAPAPPPPPSHTPPPGPVPVMAVPPAAPVMAFVPQFGFFPAPAAAFIPQAALPPPPPHSPHPHPHAPSRTAAPPAAAAYPAPSTRFTYVMEYECVPCRAKFSNGEDVRRHVLAIHKPDDR